MAMQRLNPKQKQKTMSSYTFGAASQRELETCHPDLQRVLERALSSGVLDFSITQGERTANEQLRLFRQGKSKIDGISKKGKHNHSPSLAADVMPYPGTVNGVNVWSDKERFARLAGLVQAAAFEEKVKIRWGGDWDGDGNNADSRFHDMPHYELVVV